jgi:hypothetical protein
VSRRAGLALVLGCLGVSALHLPRAADAARAGVFGPYRVVAPSARAAALERAERVVLLDAPLPTLPGAAPAPRGDEGM